jgi:inosose dehydratase
VSGIRVANAPLSYGAFEMTVGIFPNVPGPDALLAEIAAAGYEGTELGPPGYLGEGDELRERLERNGLELTGGWNPVRFSEPEHWDDDLAELTRGLELFRAAGAGPGAHPVLGDGGSDARRANPGRGGEDRTLGLDAGGWARLAEGVARAQELVRSYGFEPTFHAHTSTFVEAPWEIERMLEVTDVGLLVDSGHLLVGGSDPVQALRDWSARVNYVHIKDARLDVVRGVVADRADMLEAWRRGIFCELGAGDVDLKAFFAELERSGYEGWIVVEQDRIPREDEPLSESAEAQVRNRNWLRENAGV